MKITSDYEDTEGQWTTKKREQASEAIKARCRDRGFTSDPEITFEEPVALSGTNPVVFRYHATLTSPTPKEELRRLARAVDCSLASKKIGLGSSRDSRRCADGPIQSLGLFSNPIRQT